MLRVKDVHASYGNIQALKGVSLEVPRGQIVGVIGGNGAGKSTLLRIISGLKRPSTGSVTLEGTDVTSIAPASIVRLGLCHVPEGRHVFPKMTVFENLMMGAYAQSDKEWIRETLEKVYELFPILRERRKQYAGTLSGGEQQMLAVGRGLMSRPKVLMLDEPSMGLAPLVVETIAESVMRINATGTTVLLVEQKAPMALKLSQRVYVMETGRIVLSGSSAELMQDDRIKRIYLGRN